MRNVFDFVVLAYPFAILCLMLALLLGLFWSLLQLPFELVRKVMATCTDADYGKVSLAVVERERGMALGPPTQARLR